jgi:hypothetical protein
MNSLNPAPGISAHAAYVLAARLRERGISATGRDVYHWPPRTIVAARHWLGTTAPHAGVQSWETSMGELCPAPSKISWPSHKPLQCM